ncbi:cytochrome c oxidase assembly protein, putative [Babesia bigemina]|uniref:Cytochrome c oxidase assembly protein, putative n=1 Tax=Babesia bigemina TaxID=5866 RepID=A0A061D7D1_BABBI|nr:cytochrome c oxidase assembly protein, putative [Babesia bigemina]CDR96453.1 cytochrome c oxidase assembly protein, putative [Babesia bigemina]|eukprot:XP_012768639.1 cytochrome c oxidase assembly protein, putative [Babesia bigemina]
MMLNIARLGGVRLDVVRSFLHGRQRVPLCRQALQLRAGHSTNGAFRHYKEAVNIGRTDVSGASDSSGIKGSSEALFSREGEATPGHSGNHRSDCSRWFRIARPGKEKTVAYWLLGSAGITAGVMAIGAYVRLNESGLSMLDWHLLGKHLPKDEDEWDREFERYKATPEYKQVHYDISLEDYQNIYLNEWVHRMLGRFAGMCFGGGALFLAIRGALAPGGHLLAMGISGIGLSQAFVGKWMVESGFKEPETENKTPRVSPYRLAIHFTNALAIYSLCLWNGLRTLRAGNELASPDTTALRRVRRMGKATLASLFLTMLYGSIVAGNDAGLAYNTWPKMLDSYIPDDYAQVNCINHLFEKTGVVQFNHRCLGYITAVMSMATYMAARAQGVPTAVRKLAMGTLHASLLQVVLGIMTVVKHVPLHGAMTHHANALALWSVLIMMLAKLR